VQLTSQPRADVTITFGSLKTDGSLEQPSDLRTVQTSLTFTAENWNTPQTVVVTAAEDTITELRETVALPLTLSSTDKAYQNLAVNALPVDVIDASNRILGNDEMTVISNQLTEVLNSLDQQLQEQLKVLEVPLIGGVSEDIASQLLECKQALTSSIKEAGQKIEGVKIDDFITFIREKLKSALQSTGIEVKVTGGLATGNGIGFKLVISLSYPVWEASLKTDVGSDSFGLELDGKARVAATGTLSLGFGLAANFPESLARLNTPSSSSGSLVDKGKSFIQGKAEDLARSFFIDTDETSFTVDFGISLPDFQAEGFLGPLKATFRDNDSSTATRTKAGFTAKVGFQDPNIGTGIKFLDANKNGKLDINEAVTTTIFSRNANRENGRSVELNYVREFDRNNNGKYDPEEGTEIVLLRTNEVRYDPKDISSSSITPKIYLEPSIFPKPSVRWFDVNDTGINEGFEPKGGLLPDGTFDLVYESRFDSNGNGYYDRDDRFENRGTLYTYVPDYALQFDLDKSNGFRFLDANGDSIWNYVDFNGNGREDPGEKEPSIKSFGASFVLPVNDKFDLDDDGKYDESAGEGRLYTLWAIKSKPAILYTGGGSFRPTQTDPFVNVRNDGTFAITSALDKNKNGRYDIGDGELVVLRDDGSRLTGSELANNVYNKDSTVSLLADQFTASASVSAQLGLQAQVGLTNTTEVAAGLPNIATEIAVTYTPFKFEYKNRSGKVVNDPTKPALTASLNNIRLDLGSVIGQQVQPFAEQVDKYIAPIRPVLNALNSEIALIAQLGLTPAFDINRNGKVTVLEMAGSIGKLLSPDKAAKIDEGIKTADRWLSIIEKVLTYINIFSEFKSERDTGIIINFGDITYPRVPNSNTGTLTTQQVIQQLERQNGNYTPKQKGFADKAKTLLGESIISPLFLSYIPDLLEGKDAPLLGLQLPPLILDFNVEKTFPIWGPLSGLLQGNFNAVLNLAFGFDTSGINRLRKEIKENTFDAADSALPLDGIYISDRTNPDGTGADRPEVTLKATLAAGAGIDVGVASGYLTGGIKGTANIDLIDVGETIGKSDGRIHISEIVEQAKNGGLWNVFRLYGAVHAFLGAQIKALGATVYQANLATLPLFSFDLGPTGITTGSVFDGYLVGSQVFFDANFNEQWDLVEPLTYTNADGSYNLEVPLAFFDVNQNGQIDATEGQVIIVEGVDTSTNLPLTVPLKTTVGATVATPFTTLVAELSELDLQTAETQLQAGLGLATIDVDLLNFDPLVALAQTEDTALQNRGLLVLAAKVQLQDLLIRGTQIILNSQESGGTLTEISVVNALMDAGVRAIVNGVFTLEQATSVETLLTQAVTVLKTAVPGLTIPDSILKTVANQIAQNNQDIVTLLTDTTLSPFESATKITDIVVPLIETTTVAAALEPVFVDLFERLTTKLARAEQTPEAASNLVKQAFDLPNAVNLSTYNALTEAEQNNPEAVEFFAKQVQVQNLAVQLTELSQGVDASQSDLAAANRVVATVANYVATQPANSLQDLSQSDVLQTLVTQVAPNLSPVVSRGVAEVIAAGNAGIDAIVTDSSLDINAKLTQIAQVQYVVQTLVAEDLNKVGAGTKDIDTLVDAYTGTNLDDQIDQVANIINNPAQRTNINNRAPVATADAFSSNGAVLTIAAAQLLANDTDADGDLLQITQFTAPGGLTGTVNLDPIAQTITYKSPAGFAGTDSFFYIVTDGKGGINTAEVTIAVTSNLISGSNGRDDLTGLGTDGSDRIIGGSGADILKGGGGSDVFVYTSVRDTGDRIVDFTVGEDVIELTQLLDSLVPGGYSGADAIADSYIKLVAQGNNTVLQLDQDGAGHAYAFRNFLTLENVSVNAMNNLRNFAF
jgi:Bacterial Ig domain/RTX calcium-binding nonapeptide repeat (4 copies)